MIKSREELCEKLIGLGSWKEEIRRSLVLLFRGAVTVW